MLGALLGGVSNIIGGLFGQSQQDKANAEQRDLALNSVSYRVADAKRAGVSPIFAMGAPTLGYSAQVGNPLGDAISNAGQNIGRAVSAQMTGPQQDAAFNSSVKRLTVQKMGLENELLASQIRLVNQPGSPPAMPRSAAPGQDLTAPLMGGLDTPRINIDRRNSDAQVYENRYGNIIGDVVGMSNAVGDAYHHIKNMPQVRAFINSWVQYLNSRRGGYGTSGQDYFLPPG